MDEINVSSQDSGLQNQSKQKLRMLKKQASLDGGSSRTSALPPALMKSAADCRMSIASVSSEFTFIKQNYLFMKADTRSSLVQCQKMLFILLFTSTFNVFCDDLPEQFYFIESNKYSSSYVSVFLY